MKGNVATVVAAAVIAGCSAHDDGAAQRPAPQDFRVVHLSRAQSGRRVVLPDGRVAEGRLFATAVGRPTEETDPVTEEGVPPDATRCHAPVFADIGGGDGRWREAFSFNVDWTNRAGLSREFVDGAIERAMRAWDERVTFSLFGARNDTGAVDGVDFDAPDGKNELFFGSIFEPGYVGFAWLWWIPAEGRVHEVDVVFNDVDWPFGDAGPTSEVLTSDVRFMDLENIAAHELGHAAGLGHPELSCAQETMFAFVGFGETRKRTLHFGDIAGIAKLYP